MKKSTLALSMAAAIASFGFLGSASAIGVLENNPTAAVGSAGVAAGYAATASVLTRNDNGIGHQLVVPYFSVQKANTTMVNITNTDTKNGKLVKVRFRGAANSDDINDFQLMMSPGDVWTAVVTQDPVTGLANMRTTDTSCVIPALMKAAAGANFLSARVDPTPFLGDAANQTREGYIEIINMADIPKPSVGFASSAVGAQVAVNGTNDIGTTSTIGAYANMTAVQQAATLYGTIKHPSFSAGVVATPACAAGVLNTTLGSDFASYKAANAAGLDAPTGGLAADWVILNQTNTASWSGAATALAASGPGNLVFWPQKTATPAITAVNINAVAHNKVTADPLFTSAAVAIQNYDLPDLSTPYGSVDSLPSAHADTTSALLAVKSITNQFVTGSGIAAVTDMVFSQPTRRYSVAVNYAATGAVSATLVGDTAKTGTRAAAVYRDQTASSTSYGVATVPGSGTGSTTHGFFNTSLVNRQVCLNSIAPPSYFDREEGTVASGFSQSPGLANAFALCGEAAVASFNMVGVSNGSALNASVVRNDMTLGVDAGWVNFDTRNFDTAATPAALVSNVVTGGVFVAATALPIIGSAHMRVANGAVNYGFTTTNKVTR